MSTVNKDVEKAIAALSSIPELSDVMSNRVTRLKVYNALLPVAPVVPEPTQVLPAPEHGSN